MKKRYTIIITVTLISVAVVLLAAALIIFLNTRDKAPENGTATPDESAAATVAATGDTIYFSATQAQGATASAAETEAETEPETEEPTAAPVSVPDAMESILSQNGYTADDLGALGCRQLITVSSSGSSAQIDFYSLGDEGWSSDDSLSCYGYVGRNGVTSSMHEGGNASPMGLYSVSEAFYIYDQPATGLPTFEITNDTYWVDDPDSKYYNRRVEGTSDMDWDSAEHMASVAGYKYGFVIDYNTEAVYNAGSAIFFHISSGPTAGCVGTDESHVLGYLQKLDAAENPYIIIV